MPANTIERLDDTLEPLTPYRFCVVARNATYGKSATSDTLSITTPSARIKIDGKLKDALTGGIFSGENITVRNKTTGKEYSAITDASGNYSADVTLGKGVSHDLEINLVSQNLYNYLRNLGIRSRSDIADKNEDIVDFERFYETGPMASTAVGMDSLRDGLTWLKYMQYIGEINPANGKIFAKTRRWRDEDLPIGSYIEDGVPQIDSLYVENALKRYNDSLSFRPFRRISSRPLNGLQAEYNPNSGTILANLPMALDNDRNLLYPKDVWILYVHAGDVGIVEHELFHLLTTTHSPFVNHKSFGRPFGPDNMTDAYVLTDFEKRELVILYRMPNNTDMSCYSR
jgi:hypothetical protein